MATNNNPKTQSPLQKAVITTTPEPTSTSPLTDEQARQLAMVPLLAEIVSKLDGDAVHGRWPHQLCNHCTGRSIINPDESGAPNHGFQHDAHCPVLLIEQLRQTMQEG